MYLFIPSYSSLIPANIQIYYRVVETLKTITLEPIHLKKMAIRLHEMRDSHIKWVISVRRCYDLVSPRATFPSAFPSRHPHTHNH